MPKAVDLSGQRFGRLTAIERSSGSTWRCLCDCGNEHFVASSVLRNGSVKSCGCLRRELARDRRKSVDLSGRRFGKLTVLHQLDREEFRGKGKFYRCLCDCGRESEVSAHSLLTGNTKSCGCGNGYGHRRKKLFAEVTGSVPRQSESVIFLDGDTANIAADNMMAVSRKAYSQMWKNGLLTSDPELTKTAALACELSCKTIEAEKGISC